MTHRRVLVVAGGLLAALAVANVAQAQTPVVLTSTSTAEFTASPDHAAIGTSGLPLVDYYEMQVSIYATQLGALQFTKNLGKPTPGAQNLIVIPLNFSEVAALPPNKFAMVVNAVGPGGKGASNLSNPFAKERAPAPPGAPLVRNP